MNPRPLVLAIAAIAAVAGAVVLAGPLGAQTNPDDILDGVVRSYGDLSASWLERVLPLALKTFALLATLEFAVSGLFWALGRESLDVIAAALLKKFIVLAFLFSLLTLFPLWLPAVTRGFEVAGQTASATSALSPSRVLDLGITISEHMQASLEEVGLLANPAGVLIGCATSILVLIAYAFIAAQLCLTLVEVYLVLSGGVLFLGFAAFRVTAPFAEGYLTYSFQIGAKIYLLYLMLGPGTLLSEQWANLQFTDPSGLPTALTPHFAVMTGALVFALLVWRTGAIASRLIQGAGFHLREALR